MQIQVPRFINTCGNDHGIMIRANGGKDAGVNVAIKLKNNTALFQLIHAAHDDVFLQLETGNAIGHQPAAAVIAIIYRDLNASTAQQLRCGQTSGSGTNYAHAFRTLYGRRNRLNPAFLPCGIGDVFLNRSDGDRSMARLFDNAIAFAQPVLRANAATDFREGVCCLANLIGLFQPPFGCQPQPIGDIVMQRTM